MTSRPNRSGPRVQAAGGPAGERAPADASRPQVPPTHYRSTASYDLKGRFASYWHQCDEILRLEPGSVLEVGKGDGFFSLYLATKGLDVTTLDIDPALAPDIVGSVLQIPCADESFDVVACFQVLEHLPYERFTSALGELRRVSKGHAVLSLPDAGRARQFCIYVPKWRTFRWLLPLPRLKAPEHRFDGEHHWEIGTRGYPLRRIVDDIHASGWRLRRTYRVFEFSYHRFFVLEDERATSRPHGEAGT